MVRVKMVEIDGEKLKDELYKTDTNVGEASLELGFSKSRLSQIIKKGRMPLTVLQLIEYKYGISYDNIKPDANTGSVSNENDIDREMYSTIYNAVYNALKDALEADNGK